MSSTSIEASLTAKSSPLHKLLIAGFALLLAAWVASVVNHSEKFGDFGSIDFIEYWTAFQLYSEDRTPYDPDAMYELQAPLGRTAETPLMMWNPPWALTMMTPVLTGSFAEGIKRWFIANVIFTLFIAILLWDTFSGSSKTLLPALLGTFLFYPVYVSFLVGQVSLLIALGMVGTFWAINKERYFLCGPFLVLMTIKPHLLYLVLLTLAWWILRNRKFEIVLSFILAFGALLLLHFAQSQVAMGFWLDSLDQAKTHPRLIRLGDWQVASFVGWFRATWGRVLATSQPAWPMIVIPGVSAVALGLYLIRQSGNINWNKLLPPLLCVSVFTSPYGWIFDQSVLVAVQVALICLALEAARPKDLGSPASNLGEQKLSPRKKFLIIGMLIGLEFLILALRNAGYDQHHHFFWIPIALLFIWVSSSSPVTYTAKQSAAINNNKRPKRTNTGLGDVGN